ncbi:hypothetical protein FLA_0973 [Filimonas lacunae]|nr:hypothetical protein FLA_0973 [Filimonas lacunae]
MRYINIRCNNKALNNVAALQLPGNQCQKAYGCIAFKNPKTTVYT